jgi:hypothetical protein
VPRSDEKRQLLADLKSHPRNRGYKDLTRVLTAFGHACKRTNGSHHVWRRPGSSRPIPLIDDRSQPLYAAQQVIDRCEELLIDEDVQEGERGQEP